MVTDLNFIQSTSTGRVIVMFGATWCGGCKKMTPIFNELKPQYPEVKFLFVDNDTNPLAKELADAHDLPCFSLFKNGELKKSVATLNPERLKGMIEMLINI